MSLCPTPPDSYVEALTITVTMFITCEEVIEICGGVTHSLSRVWSPDMIEMVLEKDIERM